MKRHLIPALAIAIAATGCSAERTPAGTSADAPPPAADPGVRAANEAPAPPVDDVPAAHATTVRPGHESQLSIAADRIAFHESSGTIQSVAGDDSDLTVVARLTGEGETREATYRFRLSADGRTLTDIGSGTGMTRRRCD
jgi:hypothetical protein